MIYLTSDVLRVEISEPGKQPNDRTRFARAGFISDVTVNGSHHFCASEPRNLSHPSSGGRGLCCEYKADYSSEVEEGKYYPKLGVGLIRKDGPYDFAATYQDVIFFPVSMTAEAGKCTFITHPLPCMGYAAEEVRIIEVKGNSVYMKCTLKNVGEKPLITEEYCHNFLSIDGMAISPDYRLDIPALHFGKGRLENKYPTPCNFVMDGTGILLERAELAVSLADLPMENYDGERPLRWSLSHKGARGRVSGSDDIPVDSVTLWATDHLISPEILQRISLLPGEKATWSREWTFECD